MPKAALSKLSRDGKAVLTNNGKPAAILISTDIDNFEQVFSLVQEVERRGSVAQVYRPSVSEKEREEAFERLLKFRRKKLPTDFDYKKELMEAIDERFGSVN